MRHRAMWANYFLAHAATIPLYSTIVILTALAVEAKPSVSWVCLSVHPFVYGYVHEPCDL